ncbi:hypothetical protein ACFC58_43175, partial [Kitasatospora purpeofusca]
MVEVGCGTGVEAGVQTPHRLHGFCRVTERRGGGLTQGYRFTMAPGRRSTSSALLPLREDGAPTLCGLPSVSRRAGRSCLPAARCGRGSESRDGVQ